MRIIIEQCGPTVFSELQYMLITPVTANLYSDNDKYKDSCLDFVQSISYDVFFFKHGEHRDKPRGWRLCDSEYRRLTSHVDDVRFMMSRLIPQLIVFRRNIVENYFIKSHSYELLDVVIQEFCDNPPPISESDLF